MHPYDPTVLVNHARLDEALARMKEEVKKEVAEALRDIGSALNGQGDHYPANAAFGAADRLSSPPAPKVELPTMEDWKRIRFAFDSGIPEADYVPSPHGCNERMATLAALIYQGKARIELIP